MAAHISVSETGYLWTLYNQCCKGGRHNHLALYQSRVQCTVESHFQLPWQKLQLVCLHQVLVFMCGYAIEVPYMTEKFTLLVSSGRPIGSRLRGHAAMRLNPGAIPSGLRIEGFVKFGPLTENPVYTLLLQFLKIQTEQVALLWSLCKISSRLIHQILPMLQARHEHPPNLLLSFAVCLPRS
ncbi:hypothetical protein L195_g038393 [Trifolium pratense]|uniref:Uncharacterized protein n=1 Tax=Trifolium pratense TaxID=57577 RepID=A0A2K3LUZ3_TRIPR|nr:hypothetical protein L195_g038393 [Trifolium pratense]